MIKYLVPILCCVFASCAKKSDLHTLKVAATAVPHAEMLAHVQKSLQEEGINLEIIVIDDYNIPDRALAEKEIDANFFQHIPFLNEQIADYHYAIVSDAKIHIEPMGVYSKKIGNMADLKMGSVVAVPNDPSNEARALLLLSHAGLITLDDPHNLNATVLNIVKNPKNLKFREVEAAMMPRALDDVDIAVIPTNFALQAGLSPLKDALLIEDASSPYVNVIAIRVGEENRADLQALKKAMTSDEMRQFIDQHYHGAVIAVF